VTGDSRETLGPRKAVSILQTRRLTIASPSSTTAVNYGIGDGVCILRFPTRAGGAMLRVPSARWRSDFSKHLHDTRSGLV
jgi:hypothetical protein